MLQHNFTQGSPEWHAYRAKHFNASDAPAMLGLSKYKTRTQLLHELHTGLTPDVDRATQKLFDDGHRFEALARPLAEAIIGEELSPVIGSEGKLSASFDGLTLMEDVAWEHKTLNAEIKACNDIADLPMMYKVQMQQQLMVSGAERCLFTATSWDENSALLESKEFWFNYDMVLATAIMQGWTQFAVDLETFVPVKAIEMPRAATIMALPSLVVQIKGEVILSSMPEFKMAATAFIASIKTELITDEDFADADATVKFCKQAEENLELKKKDAIAQTVSIDELMRTMDFISSELRAKRLMLDRLVKDKKQSIKINAIMRAKQDFTEYLLEAQKETHPILLNIPEPKFADEISSLKTIKSMHSKLSDAIASSKILIDGVAREIRAKLGWYKLVAKDYEFLFNDLSNVIYKSIDDFKLLVESRIATHRQVEVAKEAKIKAEAEQQAIAKIEQEKFNAFAAEKLRLDELEAVNNKPIAVAEIERVVFAKSTIFVPDNKSLEIIQLVAENFNTSIAQAKKMLCQINFNDVDISKVA